MKNKVTFCSLFIILIMSTILFFCTKDKSIISSNEQNQYSNVDTRSILHGRDFLYDIQKNSLFVINTSLELQTFLDSVKTYFHFPQFNSFEDSMIIGIVLKEEYNIGTTFSIDSIVAEANKTTIFSHVYYPVNQMSGKSSPCHFVVTPKHEQPIIMNSISQKYEPLIGEKILLRKFYYGIGFDSEYDDPLKLIVIKNKQDEKSFLDTTHVGVKPFKFPEISYSDSMLIGVQTPARYSSSVGFELVSLIKNADTLYVNALLYFPSGGFYSDLVSKTQIVVIERDDAFIKLNEVLYLSSLIE
jgi:hypothetical protein